MINRPAKPEIEEKEGINVRWDSSISIHRLVAVVMFLRGTLSTGNATSDAVAASLLSGRASGLPRQRLTSACLDPEITLGYGPYLLP